MFKKRGVKKSTIRKRAETSPPASSDASDFSSDAENESDGRRLKRRRKIVGTIGASNHNGKPAKDQAEASKFVSDRSTLITSTNDATKRSNWYEGENNDDLSAKNLLGSTRARPEDQASDGTYKGTANYQSFIQKNPNAPTKQFGPVKAPTNIRTITVTDFAPDVCKDYKQTGFCGFGDNCKFLHAREDYKQGWQLDKDWETVTKGKKVGGKVVSSRTKDTGGDESDDDDAMLEGIPFACTICKESYKNPIITRCGHYFCEKCALQRFRKTPSCAMCGAGTGGVFNDAKQLKKLLEKKRERMRSRREKAKEAGEDVSDEDDGHD